MKIRVLLVFLLFTAGLYAQQPERKILWSDRPLSWEDFKGPPVPENGYHASANTGISYTWSAKILGDDLDLVYAVQAFFYPDFSWVSKKNDRLLAHEQLHFDISELHARKLRKALEEFKPEDYKGLKIPLQKIYEKIEAERKAMQEQYDLETRHSEDSTAQESWENRISAELKKLKKFEVKD